MVLKRDTYCGDLRQSHIDEAVVLNGWVHRWRDHGGVVFIDLRDRTGLVQVVFRPEHDAELHTRAHRLRSEYVIAIRGTVLQRPEGTVNPDMATGEIEVLVDELELLNTSDPLPYPMHDGIEEVDELHRLKWRYLDLRTAHMQHQMSVRHHVLRTVREVLDRHDFREIETPILTRSTPEGARDFLVPSRLHPSSFYALPQSPQLYKQLLMVGGAERYYQVARCFRDEDLRADRQLEFTQIDLEMSFVDEDDVMAVTESFVRPVFEEVADVEMPERIERMAYVDAIERYGCDAPDLRVPLELCTVTEAFSETEFKVFRSIAQSGGAIRALRVPGGAVLSRKRIDDLTEWVAEFGAKGLAWIKHQGADGWQSPIVKFFSEAERETIAQQTGFSEGDIVFFGAGDAETVNDYMSRLRVKVWRELGKDVTGHRFLWVVDFPLFQFDAVDNRLYSVHHPFTAAKETDWDHVTDRPLEARSRAYDLVLNGTELGGGSIRIHQAERQIQVFNALGIPEADWREKFGFLLQALQLGAPPHGGIALGLDRLVMIVSGAPNIREVIAFPKTQRGQDLVADAPGEVGPEQLQGLGIKLKPKPKSES